MKATSLIGDAKTSTSADDDRTQSTSNAGGEVAVSVDVVPDRRMNCRPDKTSVKSNKSDNSEVTFDLFFKRNPHIYKYIFMYIEEQRRKTIRIDLYSRRVSAIEPSSRE